MHGGRAQAPVQPPEHRDRQGEKPEAQDLNTQRGHVKGFIYDV